MEQQPGEINRPPYSPQPAEGAMRLWAHYAVGHGVDVVSYFRWRRCLMGQEQYHSGLPERDGSPDAGYRDAARAADEPLDLADAVDRSTLATPEADVALLQDYDNAWALDVTAPTSTTGATSRPTTVRCASAR